MKLLLYCTKAEPYLIKFGNEYGYNQFDTSYCKNEHVSPYEYGSEILNGFIVAECDYEVEWCDTSWYCNDFIEHKGLEKSCLKKEQLFDYVKGRNDFYAIHIKNLHIFDKPRELSECLIHPKIEHRYYGCEHLSKAPQNMMYVELDDIKYILISIQPQWLCKILNGEKTIEVRKKILKEMVSNE